MAKGDLLSIEDLAVHFPIGGGMFSQPQMLRAVDGVTLSIKPGESLGLVGESGCGKSTLALSILGVTDPTRGRVVLDGKAVGTEADRLEVARTVQMVFQDPYASLNPRMTVEQIVGEPLMVHNVATGKEIEERVKHLLELVGLNPSFSSRYPHEFSGGQRQRVGVARALALQPSFIICDEPISALDVSIQAQVVNLLEELQEQFNLTYLFIAHDLSMVRHISKRVAVMYLGVIVELTDRDELYRSPLHPYTQALLSAVPVPDPVLDAQRKRTILEGDVPSPANPPSGCRFRTRCPIAQEVCAGERPEFREVKPGHFVACHLVK